MNRKCVFVGFDENESESDQIRNLLYQGQYLYIDDVFFENYIFGVLSDPRRLFDLLDKSIAEFGLRYTLSSVSFPDYAQNALWFCIEFWKRTEVARKWGELC